MEIRQLLFLKKLPLCDDCDTFIAIMLLPVEAFVHHRMTAMTSIFNLLDDPIRFGVADGKGVVEHIGFLSLSIIKYRKL